MSTGHAVAPAGAVSAVAALEQIRKCQSGHENVPYLMFPDYCKGLENKGERQAYCGVCLRFKFDSERCAIFKRVLWNGMIK